MFCIFSCMFNNKENQNVDSYTNLVKFITEGNQMIVQAFAS